MTAAVHAKNTALTSAQAQSLADTCLDEVAGAMLGDPYQICENTPIFSSGRSDVPQATDHDRAAIAAYSPWALLHYLPSSLQSGSQGWYSSQPACAAASAATSTSCDEYPFYSSMEGGPTAVPSVSLQVIDTGQNSLQGSRYSSFLTSCHMNSGDAFISAPLPPSAPATTPTLIACNGH